ncbi:MAG: hypothetical protein PHI76_01815 [Clostridia bacterium]|nr:hypothetical protein [Clostridia bacterium]
MNKIINFGRIQSQIELKKKLKKICLYSLMKEDLDDTDLISSKNSKKSKDLVDIDIDELNLDMPMYNHFDIKLNVLAANTYVTGNYKGENFELVCDDCFSLKISFPLRSKKLLNEVLPIINSFMEEKPIGFYDSEFVNNATKNTRTVIWNIFEQDFTRNKIANKTNCIPINYTCDDEYIITKAELCGGHKKTPYQQTGQTALYEEPVR